MLGFPVFTARANLETACPWEVMGWLSALVVARFHSDARIERMFGPEADWLLAVPAELPLNRVLAPTWFLVLQRPVSPPVLLRAVGA